MQNKELFDYLTSLDYQKTVKIIVSNKRNDGDVVKIVIRKLNNKNDTLLFESFTKTQAFHENVDASKAAEKLLELLTDDFKQLDGFFEDKNVLLKLSKKEKLLINEKKAQNSPAATSHNREKNYILKEGEFVPALFDLGVISSEGKVINSHYDKFKQINRFIEIIDDSFKSFNKDEINIIDFGCGKSYLTFVLYHYLTEIKKIKANIVGLDLKKDVIEKCNATASKYGYSNLHFYCGDIKDYNADFAPDAVITLHACDTATDYALYNAITWGAKYIFSVPCCQHQVNSTIKAESLGILTDYGIIKERFSALITDSIRCKLLEYSSYSTDLLEFIDIAHSPKNLLIRAKLTNIPTKKKAESLEEIKKLKKEFSFTHELYNLLIKE